MCVFMTYIFFFIWQNHSEGSGKDPLKRLSDQQDIYIIWANFIKIYSYIFLSKISCLKMVLGSFMRKNQIQSNSIRHFSTTNHICTTLICKISEKYTFSGTWSIPYKIIRELLLYGGYNLTFADPFLHLVPAAQWPALPQWGQLAPLFYL